LTFIEETSKNITKNGLINFNKKKQISKIILKIKYFQGSQYKIENIPDLKNILYQCIDQNNNLITEKELYQFSLLIEPKKK
jgi:hypothetical protein